MGKAIRWGAALGAACVLAVVAWRWMPHNAALTELVEQAPPRVREVLRDLQADAPPQVPPVDSMALQHPVATDPTVALPTLAASDAAFVPAIATLAGDAVSAFVEPQGLIQRIVVSIDNLPNGRLTMKQRPLKAVAGEFAVAGDDDALVLDAANHARYAPLVAAVEQIDPAALAAVYRHFYPLFQQAYQELGYPDGYFNDRVIAVIDHLLDAPPIPDAPLLERPNVLYRYADPALEARSPGHKILMRIGPQHAARVQATLRAWRAQLAAP